MKKLSFLMTIAIVLTMMLSSSILAQSAGREPAPKASPAPEVVTPLPVGMKVQILEIKNRDPKALLVTLERLSSQDRGAEVIADDKFKTIIVRDYPENIAVMERALKRLDVPEEVASSLEIQLHLILASRNTTNKEALPDGLEDVAKQLKSTLKYSSYRYLSTLTYRVNNGGRMDAQGVLDPLSSNSGNLEKKASYNYQMQGIKLINDESGKATIQIDKFDFGMRTPINNEYRDIHINLGLTFKEGEKVIVGTANMGNGDEALILVVAARKLN